MARQSKKITEEFPSDLKSIVLKYDLPRWGTYNSPKDNERKAELPIGAWFLKKYDHDVIEIGEVMNSHIDCKHTIYDLRNEMPGTIVKDAREIDYTGKNVLSISTIEHIGSDDVDLIKRIQTESNNYLITFPVGFARDFEQRLVESGIDYFIIERSSDGVNDWTQVTNKDFSLYNYNSPYAAGNAIVVITNLNVKFSYEH
jgi:hypothetical protein